MKYDEALKLVEECGLNISAQKHDECMAVIKQAIEKQIPKKPIKIENEWRDKFICPACKSEKVMTECDPFLDYGLNYCNNCGQKLDWSE